MLLRSVTFGILAEGVALLVSFGLASLKQGREPMEPPFNWTATVLQMPGIYVCDSWGVKLFAIQALLWSIIGFGFLLLRTRKAK